MISRVIPIGRCIIEERRFKNQTINDDVCAHNYYYHHLRRRHYYE